MDDERTTAPLAVTSTQILIVDDDESTRGMLHQRFEPEGWTVASVESGHAALDCAASLRPLVIIADVETSGLQLISELRQRGVGSPVILITGPSEKNSAPDSIRQGAFDRIEKPFDVERLAGLVRQAMRHEELRLANARLLADLAEANRRLARQCEAKNELLEREVGRDSSRETGRDVLIGRSSNIQAIRDLACTLADSFTGKHEPIVLITGESGTGKELVARFLHKLVFERKTGPSRDASRESPFVAINCAAFPDTLLESELFGFERGAFTGATARKPGLFELASGGTLFLDEIGEMDLKMQAKLLRALQERVIRRLGGTADIAVHPHIIAATNRDLAQMVARQAFREDLYYRLNTLPIAVAPLRSRVEDIEPLAELFRRQLAAGRKRVFTGFSPQALKALRAYQWPGNVRELRSVIERAVILEKGPLLELSQFLGENPYLPSTEDLPATGAVSAGRAVPRESVLHALPDLQSKGLAAFRKEMDQRIVRHVLIATLSRERGNVSAVARSLRLDRANLQRLMRRYEISSDVFRSREAS